LDVAANSRDGKTIKPNAQNARKAYETILHHVPKLVLTAAEDQ
jgi:hypothetical protein